MKNEKVSLSFYQALVEIINLKGMDVFENSALFQAALNDLRPREKRDELFLNSCYRYDLKVRKLRKIWRDFCNSVIKFVGPCHISN